MTELFARIGSHPSHDLRRGQMYLTIFEGDYVGKGPESEELFRPRRIVFSLRTERFDSAGAMIDAVMDRLRRRGYVDPETED